MQSNKVPIIKTFIYQNNYYLYDCYTNKILKTTKEQYLEINQFKKIGLSSYIKLEKHTPEYSDICFLIEKGLFKSDFIKTIEHPETKVITDLLSRNIRDITLQVTKDCNFSCRYCVFSNHNSIGRTHTNTKMTWEVAKATIDFLLNHSADSQEITIAFYGGEPMLNFELIQQVVEYTETLFFTKKIKYLMTTNCSIMSEKMIAFLVEKNFFLTISFDGPPQKQNHHRRFNNTGTETFDVVYKNICKIKQYSKDYFFNNITFLPVFFEDENHCEVSEFFKEIGVSENKIHKVIADLKGIDYSLNRGTLITKENLNEIESNKNVDIQYLYIYKDKTTLPPTWHHNGPCIPGMERLFVNTDGRLYICEKSMEEDHLKIGDVFDGFNFKKVLEFLNIGLLSENDCKKCWAMRYCNICAMFCNDVEKKELSSEKKLIACKQIREDVLNFFKRILIDKN